MYIRPHHTQVITGARQVRKTTLVRQVAKNAGILFRYASADEPILRGTAWVTQQWEAARLLADDTGRRWALLILDEIKKIHGWSETVKRLWDADTAKSVTLKVILLGSAPLLIQREMTESLAGRFEIIHLPHWSYQEIQKAFKRTLDQFLFYGSYPYRGRYGWSRTYSLQHKIGGNHAVSTSAARRTTPHRRQSR